MLSVYTSTRRRRPRSRNEFAVQVIDAARGAASEDGSAGAGRTTSKDDVSMSTDPDPFEQGQRAARENIPAEANPYQDGSEQHALWASGHERVATAREAGESEGT